MESRKKYHPSHIDQLLENQHVFEYWSHAASYLPMDHDRYSLPRKNALEHLFMQGDLMVLKRQGFQKVYDLTERVLPANIDMSIPSEEPYYAHLIIRYLTANAIGRPEKISYLHKGIKKQVKTQCLKMLEAGLLITVSVDGQSYFSLPSINDLLRHKVPVFREKELNSCLIMITK